MTKKINKYSFSQDVNQSMLGKKVRVVKNTNNFILNYSDELAVKLQFRSSMKIDNKKRKKYNAPIAKYDVDKKLAYLEYPDGRIEYAKKT